MTYKIDLGYLRETIVSVAHEKDVTVTIEDSDLVTIFNELPLNIQGQAAIWGMDDSYVRDDLYEYIRDNFSNFDYITL